MLPLTATKKREVWSQENEKHTVSSLPPTFEDLQSHLKLKGIILLCLHFPLITDLETLYRNNHDAKGPNLPYSVMNRVAYGWFLTGSPIS